MTDASNSEAPTPAAVSTDRRTPPRRSRLALAAGVVGLLILAGGAVAATGVLSPGDVIPGGDPAPPPQSRLAVPETVLLTGTSDVVGPYRLTAYQSEPSKAEAAGQPCIRLLLTEPAKRTPLAASGFCGDPGKSGLSAASLPALDDNGNVTLFAFGRSPEGTSAVDLNLTGNAGEKTISTKPVPSQAEFVSGDVWVMEVPTNGYNGGTVSYTDSNGNPVPTTTDASGFFDRARSVEKLQPPE